MKEIDKTQLALAHLLTYMCKHELGAFRRLLTTRVMAEAASAAAPALMQMDIDTREMLSMPEINGDDYVLAAMQEMALAWERIRELERKKIEGWSVIPTADRRGVAIKCLHHAKDKEVCVSYRDGTLQVYVYRDGEDAPLVCVNQKGESK